jgi:hypothetical protein
VRIKTSLALALAGAISFSAAATTLEEMNVQALAANAPVAIVGKVTATRTIKTDAGIATITTYAVDSANKLWGAEGLSTIDVITEGGSFTAGKGIRVAEVSPGQLLPAKDQTFVLFLAPDTDSGAFRIVGFNQGSLLVKGNNVILPQSGLMTLDAAMAAIKSAKLAPATDGVAR